MAKSHILLGTALLSLMLLGISCVAKPMVQPKVAASVNQQTTTAPAITPPASPMTECAKLADDYDRDSCLEKLFEATLDVSICDKLTVKNFKEGCYAIAAQKKLDVSLCDKAGSSRPGCYIQIAIALKDLSLCDKIGNDNSCENDSCKNQCVTMASKFIGNSSLLRDQKRIGDAKAIQAAVELYSEENKHYPIVTAPLVLAGKCLSRAGFGNQCGGAIYYQQLPSNPTPHQDGTCADADYTYSSNSKGSDYSVTFCLGGETDNLTGGVHTATLQGIK